LLQAKFGRLPARCVWTLGILQKSLDAITEIM
jgi:hypothetical protein